ncbi:MAG: class I SAM-dependent methyltransferase [Chthoniobacteraceae bacterium]
MKQTLLRLTPKPLLEGYRSLKRWAERRCNSQKTTEQIFTEIYRAGKWGGSEGNLCSGGGSLHEEIVGPYVTKVLALLCGITEFPIQIVDLGCGDFRVGRRFLDHCESYTGVDIVPDVVAANQAEFGSAKCRFAKLNIIDDPLPAGTVCFVRQVLQHLSNEQILKILPKLSQYRLVLVTEHYPSDNPGARPNLDKVHGAGIRLYQNSGVYLDRPPFDVPASQMELVLELPGHGFEGGIDAGVIRTFAIRPPGR